MCIIYYSSFNKQKYHIGSDKNKKYEYIIIIIIKIKMQIRMLIFKNINTHKFTMN